MQPARCSNVGGGEPKRQAASISPRDTGNNYSADFIFLEQCITFSGVEWVRRRWIGWFNVSKCKVAERNHHTPRGPWFDVIFFTITAPAGEDSASSALR